MRPYCDLHTHSLFSDGTQTPAQILQEAVALELSAVALTDHDSVDGLPDFLAAARELPIRAVPGAEFAVVHQGRELHLLGLFLPQAAFPRLKTLLQGVHQRREQCVHELIDSLNRAGYRLDFAQLKAQAQGQLTRAHVALALERQYGLSAQQSFQTLLKPGAGHYTSPQRLPFRQTLELIRELGAVPVLAHPFLNLSPAELETFLPQAKRWGLVGMECLYSGYDEATTAMAFALADSTGLLPSGGSDYHGTIRPQAPLGNGKQPVPLAYLEALQAAV